MRSQLIESVFPCAVNVGLEEEVTVVVTGQANLDRRPVTIHEVSSLSVDNPDESDNS